jgi:hypothetical protein
MSRWFALVIPVSFLMSGCGPSQADMLATTTKVAEALYGTQTALAPTATPTDTPTPTQTPTHTPTPTYTPTITNTPLPPTPTLTADEVETFKLCYKAAVSVLADWEVHNSISGIGGYTDSKYNQLNAFLRERTYRPTGVQILDKIDDGLPGLDSHYPDTLIVDGTIIQPEIVREIGTLKELGPTVCDPYFDTIIESSVGLRQGPWGVGAPNRISHSKTIIRSAVRKMRTALTNVYGIEEAELEAIEDPLWQYVYDRYGVEKPDWVQ